MERVTEPMAEAPEQNAIRQAGSGRIGRKIGGVPVLAELTGIRGVRATARQLQGQFAVPCSQNPNGVESVPKADEGTIVELGNLAAASPHKEMIEATDDLRSKGRSLRSSPRTGKPFTWRREAVG
jgi:hypothetical protein